MLRSLGKLTVAGVAAGAMLAAAGMDAARADHRWHGGGVHYHHYHYRGSGGSGLAAGIFGLGAGLIIGSAISQPRVYAPPPPPRVVYVEPAPVYYYGPAPWTPDWYAYCASRYRSFDVGSGTYVSWGGARRFCR